MPKRMKYMSPGPSDRSKKLLSPIRSTEFWDNLRSKPAIKRNGKTRSPQSNASMVPKTDTNASLDDLKSSRSSEPDDENDIMSKMSDNVISVTEIDAGCSFNKVCNISHLDLSLSSVSDCPFEGGENNRSSPVLKEGEQKQRRTRPSRFSDSPNLHWRNKSLGGKEQEGGAKLFAEEMRKIQENALNCDYPHSISNEVPATSSNPSPQSEPERIISSTSEFPSLLAEPSLDQVHRRRRRSKSRSPQSPPSKKREEPYGRRNRSSNHRTDSRRKPTRSKSRSQSKHKSDHKRQRRSRERQRSKRSRSRVGNSTSTRSGTPLTSTIGPNYPYNEHLRLGQNFMNRFKEVERSRTRTNRQGSHNNHNFNQSLSFDENFSGEYQSSGLLNEVDRDGNYDNCQSEESGQELTEQDIVDMRFPLFDTQSPDVENKRRYHQDKRSEKVTEESNNTSAFKGKRRNICKFYVCGYCKIGSKCHFSHDTPQLVKKKMELCLFYAGDGCTKGELCTHLHKQFPCYFFHRGIGPGGAVGSCNFGHKCRFSHDQMNTDLEIALDRFLECKPQIKRKAPMHNYNNINNNNDDENSVGNSQPQHPLPSAAQAHSFPDSPSSSHFIPHVSAPPALAPHHSMFPPFPPPVAPPATAPFPPSRPNRPSKFFSQSELEEQTSLTNASAGFNNGFYETNNNSINFAANDNDHLQSNGFSNGYQDTWAVNNNQHLLASNYSEQKNVEQQNWSNGRQQNQDINYYRTNSLPELQGLQAMNMRSHNFEPERSVCEFEENTSASRSSFTNCHQPKHSPPAVTCNTTYIPLDRQCSLKDPRIENFNNDSSIYRGLLTMKNRLPNLPAIIFPPVIINCEKTIPWRFPKLLDLDLIEGICSTVEEPQRTLPGSQFKLHSVPHQSSEISLDIRKELELYCVNNELNNQHAVNDVTSLDIDMRDQSERFTSARNLFSNADPTASPFS